MKKPILIISEDILELRKLREILSLAGYEILTATNIKTAESISKKIDIGYVLGTRSAWITKLSSNIKHGGENDLL